MVPLFNECFCLCVSMYEYGLFNINRAGCGLITNLKSYEKLTIN